ncbi:hypothetical protein AAG570_013431 [Ranatra chinensis]|uniref:ATP-dependent RNA helicase n=1 Tax=Ranatra chinensis TaxID=642074 RepID=A0ABD0YCC1_9HEMI
MLAKRAEPWRKTEIGALVVTPTRELARQISTVLESFLKNCDRNITQMLIVGGTEVVDDIAHLSSEGATIIVGTPGRLVDLVTRTEVGLHRALKSLEMLVLDEADRLLELGFEKSLNTILEYLPKQRRTGLFSATQTRQLDLLVRAGLRNPVVVSVRQNMEAQSISTPKELSNYYTICDPDKKLATLVKFLKEEAPGKKCIVFFLTCACVEYFGALLERLLPELTVFALHGQMKKKRAKILDRFRNADDGILLATDVMERGIDIPDVSWVVQFDPPTSVSAFVHRCGRTARIGHLGSAIVFIMPNEDSYVEFIQMNQKVVLEKTDLGYSDVQEVLSVARALQAEDRAYFDMANRAFVSFIRAYGKHDCCYILRTKDLDFGGLATAFGLLRLPKMPELKGAQDVEFEAAEIDLNSIGYKNAGKEESRLKKLEIYKETGHWPSNKKVIRAKQTVPWSKARQAVEERKERRAKKKLYRKKKQEEGKTKTKRKRKGITAEELKELEENISLLKKMKKDKNLSVDDL